MKGRFNLEKKFGEIARENRFISELTLAELKFGIAKSEQKEKHEKSLKKFLTGVQILPISSALDFYAEEKARLQKAGMRIDDIDLLIASTSVVHHLVMVTIILAA